jgi:hypothetical protein
MRGKVIGLLSDDFRLYHELVSHLKAREMQFISLSVRDDIPPNVGVIIVSENLASEVNFGKKVVCRSWKDVEFSVNKALQLLKGKDVFGEIVIGIDPGAKPGIAILGDGELLNSIIAKSPEDVLEVVRKAIETYPFEVFKVKIGHGDKVNRNRIINSLVGDGFSIEVVDEERTTKDARIGIKPKTRDKRIDAIAALHIAQGNGEVVSTVEYTPTKGELKLIQSRSRTMSHGRITISKELAKRVAKGEITLEEAISVQSGGKGNDIVEDD